MVQRSKILKDSIVLIVSGILLISLSGCAAYRAGIRPLPTLTKESSSPFLDDKAVDLAYRVFDKADCKKYLDRDVIKKGYQPIHITITNSSDRIIRFSRKNINLPTVDVSAIAEKVHTNTVGRAVGFGVSALFFWPLAIAAIVDGCGSAKANEKLNADFDKKALCDQTIEPFETINGLIFVPVESFKSNFKITLVAPQPAQRIVLSPNKPRAQVVYA